MHDDAAGPGTQAVTGSFPPPSQPARASSGTVIDDLMAARIIAIPPRPGPAPACSDAELLAIAQVPPPAIETTFKEITDQMELACHGAHTFWGLLTRIAATIAAAHTLMRVFLAGQ